MAGLPRFDFYPRDWLMGTRDLSDSAKACFIDLLAGIYAKGGPIDNERLYLCRLTGMHWRTLRKALDELIDRGKIHVIDDQLVNFRAMEEIELATMRMAKSSNGGKAKARTVAAERVRDRFRDGSKTQHNAGKNASEVPQEASTVPANQPWALPGRTDPDPKCG